MHGTPACVTVNVWPAIVTVPERLVVAVLAATATATDPDPVPLAPDEMVSQPALLVEVHTQPVPALTETVVDCAEASSDWLDGEIE